MTDERSDLRIEVLRERFRSQTLSPSKLAEIVIERREAAAVEDPAIWISSFDDDRLRADAAALDDADPDRLPLYSVPVAVKDNIDVAGLPTTAGCPAFSYTPARSADAVEALQRAGALIIGKTNLDQFATGLSGLRSPYGAPRNALRSDLVPGGSSSGSAVAVARGLVSAALATDTAGSGRIPAAFNGIVGLKPTPGTVSTFGVVPASPSLDCVSVLAQTVEDAWRILTVIGESGWLPARPPAPDRLRVGVAPLGMSDLFDDQHTLGAWELCLERLRSLGHLLVPIDHTPLLAVGDLLYDGPWVAERQAAVGDFIEAHPGDVLPIVREVVSRGSQYSASDVFDAISRRDALALEVREMWREVDVIVLPTVPTVFTVEAMEEAPISRNTALGRFSHFVNLLGMAAAAVPVGQRGDGLPSSMTIIGPRDTDARVAGMAMQLSA